MGEKIEEELKRQHMKKNDLVEIEEENIQLKHKNFSLERDLGNKIKEIKSLSE